MHAAAALSSCSSTLASERGCVLPQVADAVASGHPPDLVLLDVMMPGMSG